MPTFTEENSLLASNLTLATALAEQENERVRLLTANFPKRDENNNRITITEDDPTAEIQPALAGSTKCQVSIGQGPRSYQQDIYAARVVAKLAELTDDIDVRKVMYQTVTRLGDRAADYYCGCTLSVVISRANGNLITAVVGDTRVVAFDRSKLQALSYDHKLNCATERQRVEASGSHAWTIAEARAEMRREAGKPELSAKKAREERELYGDALYVNGVINLTRSIGNSNRLPGKIHTPSLSQYQYTANTVLVIASDGLWDVVAPDELQGIWQQCDGDLAKFANTLRKLAFQRGSGDNCCVLATHPEANSVYYVADGHGYDSKAEKPKNDGIDLVRERFFKILIKEIDSILAEKKTFSTASTARQTTLEAETSKSSSASQTICSQEETDDHELVQTLYRRLSAGTIATTATTDQSISARSDTSTAIKKRVHSDDNDDDNSAESGARSKRSATATTKFGLSVKNKTSTTSDDDDPNKNADTSQRRGLGSRPR